MSYEHHFLYASTKYYTACVYYYTVQFLYKHHKYGKFQYGLKGTDNDRFKWNFHSNFDLKSVTNLPNFHEIYILEAAEILVRKFGFLH